ncbi:MAG: carbohydrate ABC transporter permease [Anaerolineae bacterium]|nr:carbohydrate ABC transporter permease [Anaerolineae bacterium]
MTLSAFKQPSEIITYPPTLFPASPSLDLLTRVWTEIDFKRYFANSLFLAITVTAIQLLTSSFVGYVLAKYQFWGRNVFFIALLSTMMIPWPVLLIPQYLIVLRLGFINTYWTIILPALYSTFGIFLMRQYMHSIPDELIDAARIDGAAEPDIFVRIILPMCGPRPGGAGHLHLHGELGQLHLAAGGAEQGKHVHPCRWGWRCSTSASGLTTRR